MDNENKKSKVGLIIAIVLIVLIILFLVCFFVLRDKGTNNNTGNNDTNKTEQTEKKDETTTKTGHEYDYKNGVLTQIVDEDGNPKQTDFVIDGVILVGNRHSYVGRDDTTDIISYFAQHGYKKEGINSSFYLNEYIGFYIDTKYSGSEENVKILVVPHKTVEELEKMTADQLNTLAEEKGFVMDYQKPDEENYKYVGENYVNMDYPEGKYDILFIYKGKIAYFINITETLEEAEK